MENKYLITMIDGGIIDIETEEESFRGCHTCDYGSEYINYITITMKQYILKIEINNEYEFALSVQDAMHIFLRQYSEIACLYEFEFKDWFKKEVKKVSNPQKFKIKVQKREISES